MSDDEKLIKRKEEHIAHYRQSGYLQTEDVIRAFRTVPREKFIGPNPKRYAYLDRPLPIFSSQTISAPHMVAMMVSKKCLDLNVGEVCLEIGGGSGYHAAVIAEIIAPTGTDKTKWGHIYTVEIVEKLVYFARENLKEAGYSDRVTVIHADGSLGFPEKAPYDKITVAAAAPEIPPPLIDQLKQGGRLVIPVGKKGYYQELIIAKKLKDGTITKNSMCGVAFVPLIGEHGFS
ncbi:MAG: protein-L-isoaspartate(D-aspartate) O-methyltransferase [Candidatus Heimdallarchaeota archaeon]